jgi:hypothetical protein
MYDVNSFVTEKCPGLPKVYINILMFSQSLTDIDIFLLGRILHFIMQCISYITWNPSNQNKFSKQMIIVIDFFDAIKKIYWVTFHTFVYAHNMQC